MSDLIVDTLSDEQRHELVQDRIWQREALAGSNGLSSKSKALSRDPSIFQLEWSGPSKPFDYNCPPVGLAGAFYNHSQMEDPYGGRWVAIEPPTEGRESLYWDTIVFTSKPEFWGSRKGLVIIDLSTPRKDGDPSAATIFNEVRPRSMAVIWPPVRLTASHSPIYITSIGGMGNLSPSRSTRRLSSSLPGQLVHGWTLTKYRSNVGRTGTLAALTTLFRGLQCGFVPTVLIKSELPPLQSDDTLTIEVDRLCNCRACTEEPHHFTLLREGVAWWERTKPSGGVPLPEHTPLGAASSSTSDQR